MKNDLLTIGPLTVHGYGLMMALGILAGYYIAEYRAKKLNLNREIIFTIVVYCVIGGFVGSKTVFFLTKFNDVINSPGILLNLSDGFVVYGAIIGGLIAGLAVSKIKKFSFLEYFDLFAPSLAIGQSFGRIGCFLAGCCYGVETNGPFGIVFSESDYAPNGVSLVPTQLIAGGLDFILFLTLIICAKFKRASGVIGSLYLILYSIGRFILEFYRGDIQRGHVGTLSTSQFISFFILLLGAALFVYSMKSPENRKIKGF